MNAKTKTLVEHYVIAVAASALAIYKTQPAGHHDFKGIAWSALAGVFGPVAKAAWDKLSPKTKAEVSVVEKAVKARVKKTAK